MDIRERAVRFLGKTARHIVGGAGECIVPSAWAMLDHGKVPKKMNEVKLRGLRKEFVRFSTREFSYLMKDCFSLAGAGWFIEKGRDEEAGHLLLTMDERVRQCVPSYIWKLTGQKDPKGQRVGVKTAGGRRS